LKKMPPTPRTRSIIRFSSGARFNGTAKTPRKNLGKMEKKRHDSWISADFDFSLTLCLASLAFWRFILLVGLRVAGFRLVFLQPFHASANVVINVSSPSVAAFIGIQANFGAVFRQAGLGLLRHAVRADTVIRGMVEVIGVALRLFQRGQEPG